jgi:hypothetical protein
MPDKKNDCITMNPRIPYENHDHRVMFKLNLHSHNQPNKSDSKVARQHYHHRCCHFLEYDCYQL